MSNALSTCYGIIEGFYGHPWTWQARHDYLDFLLENNFNFYIYAPKSDPYLRHQWHLDWPLQDFLQLQELARCFSQQQLDFGVALSPFEIYKRWDSVSQQQLLKKIQRLNEIPANILCVLFDDMHGEIQNLAELQADITHFIQRHSNAQTIIMCPTYYSYDPVLEQLFGQRPDKYWIELGRLLDPSIEIFWTGEQVCSTAYSAESLVNINQHLQRKVSLWDNYPVNDGKKTSPFLHLRAFENRPANLAKHTTRHAINPMNAAYLSQLPLYTLHQSYQLVTDYDPTQAFNQAVSRYCSEPLGEQLLVDVSLFQDLGLSALSDEQKKQLALKYAKFPDQMASEICLWLQGYYTFDPACLTG